jgi:hypothetical protein
MRSGNIPGQGGRSVNWGREVQLDSLQFQLDERIDPLETVLQRERLIISGCLAAVVVLSWVYLVHTKTAMPDMDMPGMVMVDLQKWGPATVLLLFVMWTVMMVAMMVPSAAPMILAFVTVNQRRQAINRPFVPVAIFLFDTSRYGRRFPQWPPSRSGACIRRHCFPRR